MNTQLRLMPVIENLTLDEIKEHLHYATIDPNLIESLISDPRKGTTLLAEKLERKNKRHLQELHSTKKKKI